MNTELALEFTQGLQWLNDMRSSPESPFKRLIRQIKRLFSLL